MEYTKGPWRVKDNGNIYSVCIRPHRIAKVFGRNWAITEQDKLNEMNANAQLIIAAPDMYEALKLLMKIWDESDHSDTDFIWELARVRGHFEQALAKAEGK